VKSENAKGANGEEILGALSPRARETLVALSAKAHRNPLQMLEWFIDAWASGQLKDLGDEPIARRLSSIDLPREVRATEFSVERVLDELPRQAPPTQNRKAPK
jgi:hypothetical protein